MVNSSESITNETKKSRVTRKSKKDFRDKYFIKDVENITGIKAFTIRVWEQRYGMLVPKRTDTNIRYYEEDDLKYMMNVAMLNNHGYKISKIAEMNRDEVQRRTLHISENNSSYQNQIQTLTNAMIAFDEKEFNKVLSINMLKLGMVETTAEIIFPFLQHVGILWLSGSINVAHEHFITHLIKQRLYVSIDQVTTPKMPNAKKFILFLPNGENHELSLLFYQFILRKNDINTFYLGQSLPYDSLIECVEKLKPKALMTSLLGAVEENYIESYFKNIDKDTNSIPVFAGGAQIMNFEHKLPKTVKVIKSYLDLEKCMKSFTEKNSTI